MSFYIKLKEVKKINLNNIKIFVATDFDNTNDKLKQKSERIELNKFLWTFEIDLPKKHEKKHSNKMIKSMILSSTTKT